MTVQAFIPGNHNRTELGILSAYNTDALISRQELRELAVPEALGSRHRPIGFGTYVDLVEESLDRVGLEIVQEEHLVGHEGMRYFGTVAVKPKALEGEWISAEDWRLLVGLKGSHDQSVQRGFCLGRQVFVCSNLAFRGDIGTVNTKQTLNIMDRLPGLVYEAAARVPELAFIEERRVARLKDRQIKRILGDSIILDILRDGTITNAQACRAAEQWLDPLHEEFTDNGFSLWRLEQALTEAIKPVGQRSNVFTASEQLRDVAIKLERYAA